GAGGGDPAEPALGGIDVGAVGTEAPGVLIVLVGPEQEERLAFARAFANLEVVLVPADESGYPVPTEEAVRLPRPSSPR
ncbi:MAG: hypothetical protein ABR518_05400, partial [Actinomycetota bacterium]